MLLIVVLWLNTHCFILTFAILPWDGHLLDIFIQCVRVKSTQLRIHWLDGRDFKIQILAAPKSAAHYFEQHLFSKSKAWSYQCLASSHQSEMHDNVGVAANIAGNIVAQCNRKHRRWQLAGLARWSQGSDRCQRHVAGNVVRNQRRVRWHDVGRDVVARYHRRCRRRRIALFDSGVTWCRWRRQRLGGRRN